MLTLATVRQVITIPRVLTLSCVFLAACTSQEVLHPYKYNTAYSEDISVTSKSGHIYELETPWTSDDIGNISGRGKVIVEDTWLPFEGEIPATEIKKVTVATFDDSKASVVYAAVVFGALIGAITIFAILSSGWHDAWSAAD